jgi:hypothetical protein
MSESSNAEWAAARGVEIGARASLSHVARDLLREEQTPSAYLELLLTRGLYSDAMRMLTYGLPPRRAIWWGCLCVGRASASLPAEEEAALKAAARWAREPGEARRRAAEEAMGSDALSSPAGRLAWAAHLMGSRVPYPGLPPVPPQPDQAVRALNGAVQGAAAEAKGAPLAQIQREFVALGIHVLHGRCLWDTVEAR